MKGIGREKIYVAGEKTDCTVVDVCGKTVAVKYIEDFVVSVSV